MRAQTHPTSGADKELVAMLSWTDNGKCRCQHPNAHADGAEGTEIHSPPNRDRVVGMHGNDEDKHATGEISKVDKGALNTAGDRGSEDGVDGVPVQTKTETGRLEQIRDE